MSENDPAQNVSVDKAVKPNLYGVAQGDGALHQMTGVQILALPHELKTFKCVPSSLKWIIKFPPVEFLCGPNK